MDSTNIVIPRNAGNGNHIHINSAQCVQNWTERVVVSDVFKHISELGRIRDGYR